MERARYLEKDVASDLRSRMVFVAGPRQVGKTTMARRILSTRKLGGYFNWDNREDRREIRAARWPGGRALVVLDEIHKWSRWKEWLKGEFDKHRDRLEFLVTGSARLDVYRRGGDSLQGRYHHYRLHPFSCAEILGGRAHVFIVRPYTNRRLQGLKKMPKIYMWDWSLVETRAARFENMVASHLLKLCHRLEDAEGFKCDLFYVRDRSGRELDFLVTVDRKPWFAVEAKLDQRSPDPSLFHLGSRLSVPRLYQVSLEGNRDFVENGVRCLTADRLLPALV